MTIHVTRQCCCAMQRAARWQRPRPTHRSLAPCSAISHSGGNISHLRHLGHLSPSWLALACCTSFVPTDMHGLPLACV